MSTIVGSKYTRFAPSGMAVSAMTADKGGLIVYPGGKGGGSSVMVDGLAAYDRLTLLSSAASILDTKILGGTTAYAGGSSIGDRGEVSESLGGRTLTRTIGNGALEVVSAGGAIGRTVDFGMHGHPAIGSRHPPTITMSGLRTAETRYLDAFAFKAAEKLSFTETAAKTEPALTIADSSLKLAVMLFGQYVAAGFYQPTDGAAETDIPYAQATPHQITLAPHPV